MAMPQPMPNVQYMPTAPTNYPMARPAAYPTPSNQPAKQPDPQNPFDLF